jgi:phage terminase Nu1 subunit (DNA packaging protein)
VSQLKAQGMPVDSYDSATAWYRSNIDQKLSPKLTPGVVLPPVAKAAASKVAEIIEGAYDLQAARAKREHHEANLAELKERQALGELVEAPRVVRAVTSWAAMARAAFEKIPDKVSERLAALTDQQECHALLTAEIDLVLADLAAGARALRFDENGDGRG